VFTINEVSIAPKHLPHNTHTHTLPREWIAKPHSQMALVIRSTGDQPVAIRRKYAFFHQHHQRAELNWIICMRGLSEPFYPLSFSFIHTHTHTHKQLRMEKWCNCLWFVWCIHHAKNNYRISSFVIGYAQHFSLNISWNS